MELIAIYILFLCFFFEVVAVILYSRLKKIDKYRDGIEAVEFIRSEEFDSPNRKFVANPYSLYWNAPNKMAKGILQTDERGYRLVYNTPVEIDSVSHIKILILGGSTTFSDHVAKNPGDTWVSHLSELINSKSSYSSTVEVINAGLNYATSAELLAHYVFNGQHLLPQIVILDGPGNDFLPVAVGDDSSDYRKTRKAITFQKRKYERSLLKSGVLRIFYTWWLTSANLIEMEPSEFPLGDKIKQNERLMKSDGKIYRNNVTALSKLCHMNNSELLLVDFARPSSSILANVYPEIYSGLMSFDNVCADVNLELSTSFPNVHRLHLEELTDDYFVDACHLTLKGEKQKAILVHKAVVKLLSNLEKEIR